jgi:hypothetical protein
LRKLTHHPDVSHYLEPEVEDLDALADATSGVPELAAAQSGCAPGQLPRQMAMCVGFAADRSS